jgi:hypothetical protein
MLMRLKTAWKLRLLTQVLFELTRSTPSLRASQR